MLKFETSARIDQSDAALEAPLPAFAAKKTPPYGTILMG